MRKKYTPVAFENLFIGMTDKGPENDEKGPAVRKLINFDVDGNTAYPRGGVKELMDVGKEIIEVYALKTPTSIKVHAFTVDELFVAEFANGAMGPVVSYGNYDTTNFIDVVPYLRETTVLNSGSITASYEQYIEPAGNITKEAYTGKILRLVNGNKTEDISVSFNTDKEIEVDGYIENDYAGGTYQIYDTEKTLLFTANGKVYRIEGTSVVNMPEHNYDFLGVHAGKLFASRADDAKVVFTNTQTMYFPRQQETMFDPGDGKFLGFENYFNGLVILMERGIYTISGQLPEEMIPEKRQTSDISVVSRHSFKTKGGVMYMVTDNGFQSFNRLESQASPEARTISPMLNDSRFKSENLGTHVPMVTYGNKVLTQMNDHILVYDAEMSIMQQRHWFGEYKGFTFRAGMEADKTLFLAIGNTICTLEKNKHTDDNTGNPIVSTVEGNHLEYGQRDIQKRFRDVITYQTWNGTHRVIRVTTGGRKIDNYTEERSSVNGDVLDDEESFDCRMVSPYLYWKIEMEGDFTLEDIIFWLKPQSLYAKSHE